MRSGYQHTQSFRLPGLGQTVPPPRIVLPAPPGVFDWGKNATPSHEFLPGCEPPLNGEIGATLTPEGRLINLSPKYSSARTTSKVSSGTSPCSDANARSNCQDEGTRLSGVKSDNTADDSVGDVVNVVDRDKGDVGILMERPMNMPAVLATPMDMNPAIGT